MTDSDISTAKRRLRVEAKAVRAKAARLAGDVARHKFVVSGLELVGALPGTVVSGYMPIGDEADIRPLMQKLHDASHTIALPVIVGKGQPLEFRAWSPGAPLVEAQWGILEPGDTAAVVAPDIMLSPLLAFDDNGYRLGYGGGFYDRSVSALRGQKQVQFIGVAYDEQEVDVVPRDAYDQRLDWILTPSGARKFD